MTVQEASEGDSATLPETLTMAAEQVEAVQPDGAEVEEVVADKGYHSDATLVALDEIGVRSYVSEPERGRRCWQDREDLGDDRSAVAGSVLRMTGEAMAPELVGRTSRCDRGRRLLRMPTGSTPGGAAFVAHQYETGAAAASVGRAGCRRECASASAECSSQRGRLSNLRGLLLRRSDAASSTPSEPARRRALSAICGLIKRRLTPRILGASDEILLGLPDGRQRGSLGLNRSYAKLPDTRSAQRDRASSHGLLEAPRSTRWTIRHDVDHVDL